MKEEGFGMSLNRFRLECHQTRNLGKGLLCGEERMMEDSDLRLNEAGRPSVPVRQPGGESLDS